MPRQNLSPEDLHREVRQVFKLRAAGDLSANFCDETRGLLACCRHKNHNGKHAVGRGHVAKKVQGTAYWYPTKVVRW